MLDKQEIIKEYNRANGLKRWKGKTKKEKSDHARMMINTRWKNIRKAKEEMIISNMFE